MHIWAFPIAITHIWACAVESVQYKYYNIIIIIIIIIIIVIKPPASVTSQNFSIVFLKTIIIYCYNEGLMLKTSALSLSL